MLELTFEATSVVTAVADAEAIDAAMSLPGTVRIAPDELMAVGGADDAAAAFARVSRAVAGVDPGALVVDASDGWTVCALRGDDARLAFTYLSSLELPAEESILGDVAHVPVRVLIEDRAVRLFVPAMWGAYLRERILARCRVLHVRDAEAEP